MEPLPLCHVDRIENIQRNFTEILQASHNMSYPGRLECLKLESLQLKRIKADIILAYKMVK